MKRVYFIRHGESVSNVDQIVQGYSDPLTDRGRRQAAQVATRTQHLDFEYFVTSDYTRAVETAKAISVATKQPYEENILFREIKRPGSLVGTSRNTEKYQSFLREEYEHMDDPDWQMEDGEHFVAGRDRALRALTFLEEREEKDILVVTHGHFMRYMVATILSAKNLKPEFWRPLAQSMSTDNTGITLCECEKGIWRLVTWNDHAHFAE